MEKLADKDGAWAKFAPQCMSDAGWEVAATTREAILSHRSCPWGGHLIKLKSKSIFVQNAPEDPRDVFVRPEVRAMCWEEVRSFQNPGQAEVHLRCLETYTPGHAFLERRNSMWAVRLANVFFGSCHSSLEERFFCDSQTVATPHLLLKDFPEPGASTYFAAESVWILRRLQSSVSHYESFLVFSTPEDTWPAWASSFFGAFTGMFNHAMNRHLNGPTIGHLRAVDAKMYLVLSMRNFNRGHPMIPEKNLKNEECYWQVLAGEHLGLVSWALFKPHQKFRLSEYLQCFMQQLGHQLKTYEEMDGRKLVPYQCVVVRHEWDHLRDFFLEAFRVQKTAYRRKNGGTSTPGVKEDADPHFVVNQFECSTTPEVIKTVVRKTFLEMEEDSTGNPCSLKRSSSTGQVSTYFV